MSTVFNSAWQKTKKKKTKTCWKKRNRMKDYLSSRQKRIYRNNKRVENIYSCKRKFILLVGCVYVYTYVYGLNIIKRRRVR